MPKPPKTKKKYKMGHIFQASILIKTYSFGEIFHGAMKHTGNLSEVVHPIIWVVMLQTNYLKTSFCIYIDIFCWVYIDNDFNIDIIAFLTKVQLQSSLFMRRKNLGNACFSLYNCCLYYCLTVAFMIKLELKITV